MIRGDILGPKGRIWQQSFLMSLELVEALTKRRIGGFSHEFKLAGLNHNNQELQLLIAKYLNKQDSYKKQKAEFL